MVPEIRDPLKVRLPVWTAQIGLNASALWFIEIFPFVVTAPVKVVVETYPVSLFSTVIVPVNWLLRVLV
jgi:hypothetical protein